MGTRHHIEWPPWDSKGQSQNAIQNYKKMPTLNLKLDQGIEYKCMSACKSSCVTPGWIIPIIMSTNFKRPSVTKIMTIFLLLYPVAYPAYAIATCMPPEICYNLVDVLILSWNHFLLPRVLGLRCTFTPVIKGLVHASFSSTMHSNLHVWHCMIHVLMLKTWIWPVKASKVQINT